MFVKPYERGNKMANEQMVKSLELKRKIDLLDEQAVELYETRQALDLAMQALDDIIDVPNKAASDARAVKEMVRIATTAVFAVEERE
jgi:hypothetical protein